MTAPPWRFDIAIEEDLIEEVARVYGFDRIPETDAAVHESMPALTETRVALETAADLLVQRGYFEAITYSFVDPALQARFCPGETALELSEPDRRRPRGHASVAVAGSREGAGREPAPPAAARAAVRDRAAVQRWRAASLVEVPVVAGLAAGAGASRNSGAPARRPSSSST